MLVFVWNSLYLYLFYFIIIYRQFISQARKRVNILKNPVKRATAELSKNKLIFNNIKRAKRQRTTVINKAENLTVNIRLNLNFYLIIELITIAVKFLNP